MELAIIVTLVLLLCWGGLTLVLDARQRRVDRHLAVALPTPTSAHDLPSLRRQQTQDKWRSLHRLLNYQPGVVYWRHEYTFLAGAIIAVAVPCLGGFLGFSLLYGVIGGLVAALLVVRGGYGWQQHRFRNRLFRQLADVVELITSTVRAGLPVVEAFQIVAREMPEPTARQFALVCNEVGSGAAPEEALDNVFRRTQVAEYGMFAVTLAVQMKSGGALAETLQTLGDTVRQRVALAARAKALAGEVIFSARALSAAPGVVGGLLYLVSPTMVDKLFYDPTGRILLAYAVVSVIMGTLVIRWMVRRETTI
jgi:tight adherence protein B